MWGALRGKVFESMRCLHAGLCEENFIYRFTLLLYNNLLKYTGNSEKFHLSFGAQSFYLAFIGLDYSSVSKLNSLAGLRLPELSFIQILSHYVISYPVIYV